MLRRHRIASGLTQEALAERAGVSLRGLSDLERGVRRAPYRDTAERLAGALGLDGAERAALLTATRRAGARPIAQTVGPRLTPLPVQLSSFVGRERELAEVRKLMREFRLLTLVGAGGVGKSRLAVAVAERESATDGRLVGFVDLAPLADPDLVPQTVAGALGIREQPGRPVQDTLAAVLQRTELLLLLDNCEHLVGAAASLAHRLLQVCPNLRILATSREMLGVEGETVWRLPSLTLPPAGATLEQIGAAEAVRLFVERARAAQPEFALGEPNASAVGTVCRRLDGIPLALELAAACAPLLSVEQLSGRLDDALGLLTQGSRLAPARQQTVRATIDWSYGLLTEPEQLLFDRLAVFAGGWTLEAAEVVASVDALKPGDVLPLLARLVASSLVAVDADSAGQARYRLLEALRQYGLERLAARGAGTIQRRHAEFFLALALEVEPASIAGAANGWTAARATAMLARERDNLRAALRWLLEQRELAESALRLAGVFGRFCFTRGYVAEGETWLARALRTPGSERPTSGRAKCLFALSTLALTRGDYASVERNVGEALALWQRLAKADEECWSLFVLGFVARRRGNFATARGYLQAGVQRSRAAGQGSTEACSLWALAEVAADLGDDAEAHGLAEAALVRAREAGWTLGVIVAQRILGTLAIRRGDYAIGQASLDASLALARQAQVPWWTAETLVSLGKAALEQGDLEHARRYLAEGLAVTRDLDDRFGMAGALEAFVRLAVAQGAPREALRFAGAAASLRAAIGTPLPPAERPRFERQLAPARSALGDRAAAEAWDEGRIIPLQQHVEHAVAQRARPGARGYSG